MSSSKPPLEGLRIKRDAERSGEQRPKSGGWLAAMVVVLLLGAVWWWRSGPIAIPVHIAVAREVACFAERTVLNASGYVTARRQATVSSKVTGKVTEVDIEEGMKVKEGQILARLDDTNVKASFTVAQAQLNSARIALGETEAQIKAADREFQRTSELAKQNIASPSDLDRAESDAKLLEARLERQKADIIVAESQVTMNQQLLDDMTIRAPFDGIVTTKDSQPGEMISPVSAGGGFTRTGIGTVVDMKSLEIEIDVNESYINRVEPAQPVEATLDVYPDWKIPCKVIAIIPTADRQKSTVKVRVGFNQLDPRILPEMSVKVAFREAGPAAASHGVIIPKSAVRNQDNHDIVFVLHENHAERRAVTVASTQDEDTTLNAGVTAGEKVIVDAPAGLADGVAVKETKL